MDWITWLSYKTFCEHCVIYVSFLMFYELWCWHVNHKCHHSFYNNEFHEKHLKSGLIIVWKTLELLKSIYKVLWVQSRLGSQKECLAPNSLSKHYFEWPLHLRNNLFGRFSFHQILTFFWLKWRWFLFIWIIKTCP